MKVKSPARRPVGPAVLVPAFVVSMVIVSGAVGQAVRYVDDDAPSGGDGLSWETAYRSLQDAIDAARRFPGIDEVRVAAGVYRPDDGRYHVEGDREAAFTVVDDVRLLGGYAGLGAPDPDARDVSLYRSELSGEIGDPKDTDDNTIHVLLAESVGPGAVLDGLVITNGNTNFAPNDVEARGAGLLIFGSGPTIRQCTFEHNRATGGAAITLLDAAVTISDCTFFENETRGGGGAIRAVNANVVVHRSRFEANRTDANNFGSGGAVSAEGGAITMIDCDFVLNFADGDGGGFDSRETDVLLIACRFTENEGRNGAGGGRAHSGTTTLVACSFIRNDGTSTGSAAGGGFDTNGETVVRSCLFHDNFADRGGGMAVGGSSLIANSVFDRNSASSRDGGGVWGSDVEIVNTVFAGNVADDEGGAAFLQSGSLIVGCTIVGNDAVSGDGLFLLSGDFSVRGCILWANGGGAESQQIRLSGAGSLAIDYSCVQGLTGALGGTGNIGSDPLFVDRLGPDGQPGGGDDDLRLLPGSPCIDAADSDAPPACVVDLDGNTRFVDDPATEDTGVGMPPIIDMGAYEFPGSTAGPDCDLDALADPCAIALGLVADCNMNGQPDACDIADGTSVDCNANGVPDNCEPREGDCNDNGIPDECDFAAGVSTDCNGNGIPDECDEAVSTRLDCNRNGRFDECEHDCNGTGLPDSCDIMLGISVDENANGIPDECDAVRNVDRDRHYDSIARALTEAFDGDEITVGPGTYPDALDLDGKAITLRSTAGPESTIIEGDLTATMILCTSDEGPDTVIEGFTIRAGNGNEGGGLLVEASRPTIRDCVFEFNRAGWDGKESLGRGGGAAVIDGAAPTFDHCVFRYNRAAVGAGLYIEQSDPIVRHCVFSANIALRAENGGGIGGGAYVTGGSPSIHDCEFSANEANDASRYGGGGMMIGSATATVSDCSFVDNRTTMEGGGLAVVGDGSVVERCRFVGNTAESGGGVFTRDVGAGAIFASCLLRENTATDHGGALRNEFNGHPAFIHCTMTGNSASVGGGISHETGVLTMRNCIVWANDGGSIDNETPDEPVLVSYSVIDGGYEAPFNRGVFTFDPLLAGVDAIPAAGSPAIDAGDPLWIGDPGETDLAGAPRQFGCRTDLGPYESDQLGIDCDSNGISDGCDILEDPALDCNGNGLLDACDINDGLSDCDGNGVVDACETSVVFVADSGRRAPFSNANPAQFVIPSPPSAQGLVALEFLGLTRLQGGGSAVRVFLNGEFVARVFSSGSGGCPVDPRRHQLVFLASTFNDRVGGGDAIFDLDTDISGAPCPQSFVRIRVTYGVAAAESDCDGNGRPDACDEDRDGDGVNDPCDNCPDHPNPAQHDCDGDGVGDVCRIVLGESMDCDGNGIPDECDVLGRVNVGTGLLSPFGRDNPQVLTVTAAPAAASDVVLRVRATGPYAPTSAWFNVDLNGTLIAERVLRFAENCSVPPDEAEIVVTPESFNALVPAGSDAVFSMVPSGVVNETTCVDTAVEAEVSYAFDRNDCNGDGVPDACDCAGDITDDCVVDFADIIVILQRWGPCTECPEDLDGDGTVGFGDVIVILTTWGSCL